MAGSTPAAPAAASSSVRPSAAARCSHLLAFDVRIESMAQGPGRFQKALQRSRCPRSLVSLSGSEETLSRRRRPARHKAPRPLPSPRTQMQAGHLGENGAGPHLLSFSSSARLTTSCFGPGLQGAQAFDGRSLRFAGKQGGNSCWTSATLEFGISGPDDVLPFHISLQIWS